jgi:hypothetical protein
MSRKLAALTQADVSRAIRAAKAAGLQAVEITTPGGAKIRLPLTPESPQSTKPKAGQRREVML